MDALKSIAVILAGGSGQRLGGSLPKQFLKIAGKSVIEHTLDVFQKHSSIGEIVVVAHKDFVREVEALAVKNTFTKLKKILIGGQERYHSSLAAINAYDNEVNLIFHDSVRPLVNDRIIDDCIQALSQYNAVDVAIPTTDTIIEVDSHDHIAHIPVRSRLRNGQTPQAFKRSTIKRAYEIALQDPNFVTTDDCGVVLKYLPDEKIKVVQGEQFNLKLTYKEDIFLLDKLFQLKSIRSEEGQHLSENALHKKVMVVLGGTEGIGLAIANMARSLGAQVVATSRRDGVDVSNSESVQQFFKQTYEQTGQIDFVINTAGVLDKVPLFNMTYEDIIRSIHINYLGSIICAKESLAYLKDTQGMLLLFTSSSYTRGRSLYSVYSSSKAAIVNLTQALSEEWGTLNVKINCINPERTLTPMRVKNFGNEPKESLLSANDVALHSIRTLLSEHTGQVIDVKKQ